MTIGLYLRLSEADEEMISGEKNESDSIENQRLLLHQYVASDDSLRNCSIKEYVDDGFTGTNFTRPSFIQMIEDAKHGLIQVVIVKDLSRLGRDYISAGDYIEQIFPLLNVRFIAVNNHYDSALHEGEALSFDVAVSNLINTMYSRDLSQKLRYANLTRWKQGISTSGWAPFGYLVDRENKGKWKIDPEAADIVRQIFDLAVQGNNPRKIAECLNEQNLPCPSVYNHLHENEPHNNWKTQQSERLWDSNKVLIIIRRYEYTGAMVMGKTKRLVVGKNISRTQTPAQRIIVEGVNPAIISHEIFSTAQNASPARKNTSVPKPYQYPLKGKLRCGTCRLMLVYTPSIKGGWARCGHAKKVGAKSACYKGKYAMQHIEEVVFQSIQKLSEVLLHDGKKGTEKTKLYMTDETRQYQDLEDRIRKLSHDKLNLYERYADGSIAKNVYLSRKEELNVAVASLRQEQDHIRQRVVLQSGFIEQAEQIINISQKNITTGTLTREVVDAMIEDVFVYDPQQIEIVFKYADIIQMLCEKSEPEKT